MRCVRASNVPHTSEQKVHSTFNCGGSQATTRVLVVKTGIEVLRQKSKSIRGQTERTRRHLRNDYRLTDGQKTSRNIDPMRLQQICFGYSQELDNQEQHKLHCGKRPDCFGTKYTGSCHVPTQLYMYVIELMQVNSKGGRELKGWPRGWSNLDSFRPE